MTSRDLKGLILLAAIFVAVLKSPDLGAAALVVYLVRGQETP
jgi:hypothetical protein